MDACFLPKGKRSATYPHFPAPAFAVIFRNWGLVAPSRIAKVLDTDEASVCKAAEKMGLDPNPTISPLWQKRGFLTVIRNNWNLCDYDQIKILVDMTDEQLEFTLREDDFMWDKMGSLKPVVERPFLAASYPAEVEARLEEIAALVRKIGAPADNSFEFLAPYTTEPAVGEVRFPQQESLRLIYSYFALYGDTLAGDAQDSYPETLLAQYAENGVNAIWFQALLRQLAPNPWDDHPEDAAARPGRLESLRRLVDRAAKYGIGVYLYINEPRPEPDSFFEKFPHLKGAEYQVFRCLCTSLPEVQQYLEDSMEYIFREVPGLAGYFDISYSENFTNCCARGPVPQSTCPRCKDVPPQKLVSTVNNCMARGAKRSNPNVRAIAHSWAWDPAWDKEAIAMHNEGQYLLSVSEEHVPFTRGGVDGYVRDYSMSVPGPGEKATRRWNAALENGMKPVAKIQINGSWEMSAMPFVPIFGLIGEHLQNVKNAGVRDVMLTWTVGGSPSPITKFTCAFLDSEETLETALPAFLKAEYGAAADVVAKADAQFCKAFREYPFDITVIYNGPHTFGPMAPFFEEPSGCASTMVGFPYDDLDGYRSQFPREVFESQFGKMTAEWKKGLDILESYTDTSPAYVELCRMAKATYCHIASTYNHIRHVRHRDLGDTAGVKAAILDEQKVVEMLMPLRAEDSRIGFEASNQYYFSMQDLVEKQINLAYLADRL